jgi:hypothetical protein
VHSSTAATSLFAQLTEVMELRLVRQVNQSSNLTENLRVGSFGDNRISGTLLLDRLYS